MWLHCISKKLLEFLFLENPHNIWRRTVPLSPLRVVYMLHKDKQDTSHLTCTEYTTDLAMVSLGKSMAGIFMDIHSLLNIIDCHRISYLTYTLIDLVQDCTNCIANALELLQFCTKQLAWFCCACCYVVVKLPLSVDSRDRRIYSYFSRLVHWYLLGSCMGYFKINGWNTLWVEFESNNLKFCL